MVQRVPGKENRGKSSITKKEGHEVWKFDFKILHGERISLALKNFIICRWPIQLCVGGYSVSKLGLRADAPKAQWNESLKESLLAYKTDQYLGKLLYLELPCAMMIISRSYGDILPLEILASNIAIKDVSSKWFVPTSKISISHIIEQLKHWDRSPSNIYNSEIRTMVKLKVTFVKESRI